MDGGVSSSASIASSSAIGELVTLGVEELDAVVLGRVVGGGEDDAEILRQQRDRGRRQHAADDRDPACRDDPLDDGLLERRAGAARVAADEDAPAARPGGRRTAEPLDEIEGERLADDAANAIGAEVSASHGVRRRGGEREHAVGARAV